ncbi:Leucine-rich repeat protein kinase family protein [Arabidopsis thaliana]|uniref:Leucine-rich repeat protein kinase family protein n=1 Tax=Arabidopsis thaliana TaxID=3702 RepID=F4I233_ARATH|nr:Leucine-rich repeat protein kinase family protein [Arabidopsis thaliana]AEE34099.1 Leucine-rich repeat protein kinase family protein [Arabidopsis thaliana]|eukprot:NP_001185301.1 Leucine-rich repeat protein kinase family protein [Arabidopsis thaliana]
MRSKYFCSLALVLGLFFVSCDGFASNEVQALRRFKEAIYEDPLLVMSNWNDPNSDPCDWTGIYCSPSKDHVIKINISASSIKGFLAPELGQITYLQELILHGNILIGTIPKEIGNLKNLKILDLGNNHLMGPIPAEIGSLSGIMIINLQSNGLTGKLPAELGNLKYLRELHIDRNRLQGSLLVAGASGYQSKVYSSNSSANIAGLCKSLKVADFSYNFFVGNIPKCLENLPRTSFQGNCMQNKDLKHRSSSQCANAQLVKTHGSPSAAPKHQSAQMVAKHHRASKPKWLLALEIVTGSMVGLLLLVALFSAVHRWNNRSTLIIPWKKSSSEKEKFTVYVDSEMLKDVSRLTRQELEVACEDFSNIIGLSADSQIYKGTLKGGSEIAVISLCVKEEDWTGYLELYFQREVADLARLNHENTAKLLGYCKEISPFTRMLVFEYASNGTLYEHLHYGEAALVSWARRMKIVIGIARGLKYLHMELDPPFTISELSSNAIYLTEDFTPKLVDFECWKTILARSEKNLRNISSQGSICVLPNGMESRYLDVSGNIYAFGILLLEIVSGRPPYCKDKGFLIEWLYRTSNVVFVAKVLNLKRIYCILQAKEFLEAPEAMSGLVDPELKHFNQEDLETVCEVASQCLNRDPTNNNNNHNKPSVQELCETLESRISLSISAELRSSSLAWAELALDS